MSQGRAIALVALAVLVGLLALHPLSSAYAGPVPHPGTGAVATAQARQAPVIDGSGHAAGCPETSTDAHPAPLTPSRDHERAALPVVDVVPVSGPMGPIGAHPTSGVQEPVAPAGARLLIGLCVSRT